MTGLLGGTHCIGMCGGISAALSFACLQPAHRAPPVWLSTRLQLWTPAHLRHSWCIGRLLGQHIIAPLAGMMWLRLVAGLFMVAMGLYLAGWWNGSGQTGAHRWRSMAFYGAAAQALVPVNHPLKAVLVGSAWGFLPCGLVYSALTLSLARSDAMMSGLMMMAFGMGTLPFLLLTGTLAAQVRQILQRPGVRQSAGLAVIAFGLWTAIPFFAAHGHGSQDAHAHHESPHPMPATPAESDDAGADMHHHHH
jgi:sulfite exporter TauE/SafE